MDKRGIVKDPAVFSESNKLPGVFGRKSEFNRILGEFRAGPLNITSPCAVVYGGRRSGKSVFLREAMSALRKLSASQDGYELQIVHVDCASLETTHDLFFAILAELEHESTQHITPEKRKFTTYTWLEHELEQEIKNSGADLVIFALDDIDELDTPADALERLVLQDDDRQGPRVGFVATSTSRNVVSGSHELHRKHYLTELTLSRFTQDQYRHALKEYADAGFKADVISTDLLYSLTDELCEFLHLGDGLEILKRVGIVAEQANADTIEREHVDQALRDYDIQLGINWLLDRNIDIHNQALLLALTPDGDTAEFTRLRAVYETYSSILERTSTEPLSYRRFRERTTSELLEPFIEREEQNEGSQGGRYFEVKLDVHPQIIYTALWNENYRTLPDEFLPTDAGTHFPHFEKPLRP